MKRVDKKIIFIIIRYLILLLVILPGLGIFYYIFSPITIKLSYFLLNIFYDVDLNGRVINILNIGESIEIIEACVAGSAYYLLLILNLSIPVKSFKKRILMISYSFLTLLFFNIIRIFILSILLINKSQYFDFSHKFFWYFLSTIFVVIIWFSEVYIFKEHNIPFITDLKIIYKSSNLK